MINSKRIENQSIIDRKGVEQFRGSRVLIVGLARTGIAAAKFLSSIGCKITITECRRMRELTDSFQEIKDIAIQWEFGGHREETFVDTDWILVSPGVPMHIPPLVKASTKGIPILSDIELAYLITNVPILAITGTNGKTTTTTLLGEILNTTGQKVFVGGNIGTPILNAFVPDQHYDLLVVEVSSFQLEGVTKFAPHLAIILNLTPDHLDRYQDITQYQRAKAKILNAQTHNDYAILNAQDPWICSLAKRSHAKVYFFDSKRPIKKGAGLIDGHIIIQDQGTQIDLGPVAHMGLKGLHNLENMMSASLAAYLIGTHKDIIKETLRRFRGLEHRLEKVRDINGIQFINDSKGTNIGALMMAIESIDTPIILIAGGQDKGGDFGCLAHLASQKIRAVFAIGQAQSKIAHSLGDYTQIVKSDSLRNAVINAYEMAKTGDTVLLSPGCASFDMFRDYKDRGDKFKQIVMEI